jgi:hypothetical protein
MSGQCRVPRASSNPSSPPQASRAERPVVSGQIADKHSAPAAKRPSIAATGPVAAKPAATSSGSAGATAPSAASQVRRCRPSCPVGSLRFCSRRRRPSGSACQRAHARPLTVHAAQHSVSHVPQRPPPAVPAHAADAVPKLPSRPAPRRPSAAAAGPGAPAAAAAAAAAQDPPTAASPPDQSTAAAAAVSSGPVVGVQQSKEDA